MNMNQRLKLPRFMGIREMLLISAMLVIAVYMSILFAWFYNFSSQRAWNQIVEGAKARLTGTLEGIDGDEFEGMVADMRATRAEWQSPASPYPADERFWEHVNWLLTVHKIDRQAYVYTYIAGNQPGEVLFIGSHGAPLAVPEGAVPFETYNSELLWQGLAGYSQNTDTLATPDDYGVWALTVCQPIFNSHGQVVGAVGIDIQSNAVVKVQKSIRLVLILAFLFIFVLVFITVFWVATSFVRPIVRLTEVARNVARGNYSQDLTGLIHTARQNEISILAQVFDEMLDKLNEREKQRHPARSLNVEIDQDAVQRDLGLLLQSEAYQHARQALQDELPDGS